MSISLSHTGLLFAGTGLTISCTVTLDSSVNNNERVTIDWSDIPPERYSGSPVIRESDDGSYTGRLTISPLTNSDDGISVTCTGRAIGETEPQYSNSSDEVILSVEGKLTHSYKDAVYVKYLSPQICQIQRWLSLDQLLAELETWLS